MLFILLHDEPTAECKICFFLYNYIYIYYYDLNHNFTNEKMGSEAEHIDAEVVEPIKSTDVEWNNTVHKLLHGPSDQPRVYTAEQLKALQAMRLSFPDEGRVPEQGTSRYT